MYVHGMFSWQKRKMKHGAWLRNAARELYYLHYRQPDGDFIRAKRKREPAYLVAVDYAYESRKHDAEWVAQCPIAFVRAWPNQPLVENGIVALSSCPPQAGSWCNLLIGTDRIEVGPGMATSLVVQTSSCPVSQTDKDEDM